MAVLLLIGAQLLGTAMRDPVENTISNLYRAILPEAAGIELISLLTARAFDADGDIIAYIGVSESLGYGGPMLVGTIVNPDGRLREPVILRHNETPSWMTRVRPSLARYEYLSVDSMIMLGHDIDIVTGTTRTARAVSDAVRQSAHSIAVTEFGLSPAQPVVRWQFGKQEISVILLFALSIAAAHVNFLRKFRLVVLCLGIFILGIWLNLSLSIVHFSSFMLGFFPEPKLNLLLYIFIAGALLPILLFRKNLYCAYICPFCGIQELLHKVTGKNISLGKARIWFERLRNVLLFVSLMAVMLTARPNAFFYEPFGLAFTLDRGTELYLWIILFAALGLGFFFRRFWCVALCPAGAFLDTFRRLVTDARESRLGKKIKIADNRVDKEVV